MGPGKACQKTRKLIGPNCKLQSKKRFANTTPDIQMQNMATTVNTKRLETIEHLLSMTQFYKTFYGRNLRIFVISQSVCLWQSFQPSLNFGSKARACACVAFNECSTLGEAPVTHSHSPRLEKTATGKHSSLLPKFVNNDRKIFYNTDPCMSSKSYITF